MMQRIRNSRRPGATCAGEYRIQGRASKLSFLVWLFAACMALDAGMAAGASSPLRKPFPPQFPDSQPFAAAIAKASRSSLAPQSLSGIAVSHHLLAAELIALSFRMAERSPVNKVVVLFPDHFERLRSAFATTRRPFDTAFGRVESDQASVRSLLRTGGLVRESDLFGIDHGLGAILPFIKHYFPRAGLIPIAVSIGSTRPEWDRLADRLERILGLRTLIVQSTDFSHYLTAEEASQRDQEVLNILAADNLDAVARLRQPQHTDSRGSQYLQMRLQRDLFHARPVVMFNANSQAFATEHVERTTSYIVEAYGPPLASVGTDAPGSKVFCFAGDTFFGRGLLAILTDPGRADRLLREARSVLNGCRLIVNLTGVLVPELPVNLDKLALAMPSELALRWLKALNVKAVSLANNHTMDLGPAPYAGMVSALREAGIAVLQQGSVEDLGPFRLAALSDLDNRSGRREGVITTSDIAQLSHSGARPPLFVMINWGVDYVATPDERQLDLRQSLRLAAASLLIGVHPHLPALGFDLLGGGEGLSVHSLGNFIFDQDSRVSRTESILEIRMFDQGTYFARLITHRNLFDGALQRQHPE